MGTPTPLALQRDINDKADGQGWCVSRASRRTFEWQLQKLDEAEVFESDEKAQAFVVGKALGGDATALEALGFLAKHCPEEYANVLASSLGLPTVPYNAE